MQGCLGGLLVAGVLAVASTAVAKDPPEDTVVYKKRTVIDLRGETIDGTTEQPGGTVVDSRPPSRFPVVLPLRLNFRYEILSSGSML